MFEQAVHYLKSVPIPVIGSATGGIVSAAGAANVLPAIGFGAAGVKAGSVAACIQSTIYGAAVPAGSWFATATSLGATGALAAPLAAVAGPVGAVAVGAAWYFWQR